MLQTDFQEVYDPAGFSLIHIDTDGISASALHNHWDVHNPTFPVLVGCNSQFNPYSQGYIPHNVVIDTEGIIRYSEYGFNENAMHNIINQYMSVDVPVFSIEELALLNDDNGDGRPDAGETVDIQLSMQNTPIGVAGSNVSVTMTCDDPDVTITNHTVSFPDADPGDIVAGDALFSFTVASEIEPHWAEFTFTYSATYADGNVEESFDHLQRMGRPDLLVVDSDGGTDPNNELFVTNALDGLDSNHDVWSGTFNTPISSDELMRYNRVIWIGGSNEFDVSADDATNLANFMDNGGQLILSSQYLSADGQNAQFLADYFGVEVVDEDGGSIFVVDGVEGDPWFGGTAFVCTGVQGANNNTDPDILAMTGDLGTVFGTWRTGDNPPAGVYVDNGVYKAIFMGFAVEATRVHGSVDGSMDMSAFLTQAFDFLGETGVSTPFAGTESFRLEGAYPNPFNPTTTVEFTLESSANVSLVIHNTLGQEVARMNAGPRAAGTHSEMLRGEQLASGLYLVDLVVDGSSRDVMKVMLIK